MNKSFMYIYIHVCLDNGSVLAFDRWHIYLYIIIIGDRKINETL